ncbi:MAG TPA: hypothetical protein VJ890_07425, partial [Vineibacter sp.]|nr:hypothetical protein [Vineibacter sp.]
MAYGLAALAIVAGTLTYAALTGLLPRPFSSRGVVRALFLVDLGIVIALATVVVVRLARAFIERRRGVAGARLHLRLVLLFGLFAVAPTFAVAMGSGYWLSISLREWLSNPLEQGLDSAQALLNPVLTAVMSDVDELSKALQAEQPETLADSEQAKPVLARVAQRPNLLEASIVDTDGKLVASSLAVATGSSSITLPSQAI